LHTKQLLFYDYFADDIRTAKKVITIRDHHESDYSAGDTVRAVGLESGEVIAMLYIEHVAALRFDDINEHHAAAENMSLEQLKRLIGQIYPDTDNLYLIEFKLSKD